MDKLPLVSIICTSYNHEKFIGECLQGFIMQETNFAFEIIVHDDASTDNTQKIIKEFESKYPDLFINIYQTENQFSKKEVNIWSDIMFPKVRGKYIAICEGDDYWIDENKLQKQVDFLENNIEFNFVGHYSKSSNGKDLGKFNEDIFEFNDIYQRNIRIPTASFLYRNNFVIPDWFSEIYGGDRAIIFLNAQKGKLKILPFFGSFYRLHQDSVEHNLKRDKFNFAIRNIKEEYIYYKLLQNELDVSIIKKRILKNHYYMVALGIKKMQLDKSFKAFKSLMYFYFYNKIKF
jgi:glycosyltransferase involved in cell wall biosynthesis